MTDSELNALSALVHAHCVAQVGKMQTQDHQQFKEVLPGVHLPTGYHCAGPAYADDGEGQAIYDELVRRGILRKTLDKESKGG